MDVQEAIKRAKAFVDLAFSDEDVGQVRTEEVEFDGGRNAWLVTLGLMRPSIDTRAGQVASMLGNAVMKRSYKVFVVNNDSGTVDAVKIKQFDE